MAGVGPAPKEKATRRNKQSEKTRLVAGENPVGPELPEGWLPDGEEWHAATRSWWEHWRTSPQASRMLSQPDWDFLLDTALMHHTMWAKGRWEFASEVRLRAAKFGATPEDRLRLRQEIDVPEEYPVGAAGNDNVTSIESRRDRWSS